HTDQAQLRAGHALLHPFPTRRSSDLTWIACTTPSNCTSPRSVVRTISARPMRSAARTSLHSPSTSSTSATFSTRTCVSLPQRRRSEEHTSELQSRENLVCRLLLEKKN